MPNFFQMTSDNTKQIFMDVPLTFTQHCWERLHKFGSENYVCNDNGNDNIFKSSLNTFNPMRWIRFVVPDRDSISPYESEKFYICQYKKRYQLLTEAGGFCNYLCKYLSKIDKQDYINILMDNEKKGSYVPNSTYIHNTKILHMISNKNPRERNKQEIQNILIGNVQN